MNSQTTELTIYISALERNIFFTRVTFIIGKELLVTEHSAVGPVIIDVAFYPQIGTQTALMVGGVTFAQFVSIIGSIGSFDGTSDFNVVSFFLQSSYANAQVVQLVSEFSSQFVNVSAFCHCFSNDLSHFITGHQLVATEGGVAVAFDYASSSQFVDAVISPVASRNVRERVSSVSGSSYTKSHCHCEN